MLFSCIGPISASAASVDVGTNPTPKIDIAVNVPSDYPGTFLDFKQELTQKLIEQGLNPSDFRITNTDVTIDMSNLDGWYIYDHYYSKAEFNKLKLSTEQEKLQPFRQADNSCISTETHKGYKPTTIPAVFISGVNSTIYNIAKGEICRGKFMQIIDTSPYMVV